MEKGLIFEMTYAPERFSREDESDDIEFYAEKRIVDHLDSYALETVESIIGQLIIEESPVILDLMAGWNSHIPETLKPEKVIGLGLNKEELEQNKSLDEYIIHDLNKDPMLPFADSTFDAVLNTVSVDYMTKPFEVAEEVNRILKPGGIFIVVFSDRMFPQKAIRLWKESSDQERIMFVEDLFIYTDGFEPHKKFASRGKPRPKDDKYSDCP